MEALEPPHDTRAVRLIHSFATATGEDAHLSCVAGNWDLADDVGAEVALFKNGFDPDTELDLVLVRVFLHNWHDFERQVDVL